MVDATTVMGAQVRGGPGKGDSLGRGLFLCGSEVSRDLCRLQEACLCSYSKGNKVPTCA